MALLERFGALYRATSIDPATFTDGDDWPNEGFEGSAYDAVAKPIGSYPEADVLSLPHFVTSPAPGFEISGFDQAYYYVPDGSGIRPATGSFTVFGQFYWPDPAGALDNVFAKIETPPAIGSGGRGWQVFSGSAIGNATFGVIANGGSAFQVTDPMAAISPGLLSSGEHLVVMRLDRSTETLDLFIDNVLAGTISSATVTDVTAAHEWIFGRGKTQTGRAYGLIKEALNDYEIQLLLPYELGEDVTLFPTLSVETSLTTDPLDTPSWEDQTGYVTSVQYRRGRDQALAGQFQPGTASVRLDNPDRRFDPNHAGGPHYGELVPGKRMRVRAEWLGETYDLFGGFVDGWPQEYQFPFAASSTVPLSDGLTLLNRAELAASPFESVLESLNPVHWWKLGEPEGSAVAHDSGSGRADGIVRGQAQDGFGADGMDVSSNATALAIDPEAVEGYVDVRGAGIGTSVVLLFSSTRGGPPPFDSNDRYLFYYGNEAAGAEYLAQIDDASGAVSAQCVAGGSQWSCTTPGGYGDGEPHLLVVTVDGTTFRVYVDGQEAATDATPSVPSGFEEAHNLGENWTPDGYNQLNGRLQHVAYLSDTITAAQVSTLYEASRGGLTADTSGERIERLLDLAQWPTADRDIDTGEVTLEGVTDNQWNGTVLDTARIVEESEAGAFYQEPDYTIRFRGRYDHLTATRSTTSQYTFSDEDTDGVYHYEDIVFPEQSTYLHNRVKVQWLEGEEVVTDPASVAAYGPREHSVSTILPTAAQARSLGEWIVSHYSQPVLRVDSITLNPAADPRLWVPCLDLREGDRVTVRKHPQEVGDPIEAELIVEGITASIGDGIGEGTFTFTFSSADTQTYWIWGTSEWDTETRWA